MVEATLKAKAEHVLQTLRTHQERLVTAESCTGGLIAATLTALPGASESVEGGLVTYSNNLKTAILNVATLTLDKFGAVSEAVAQEMAEGALKCAKDATISIAVTGIAGPDGGCEDKPVGTVCLCILRRMQPAYLETAFFSGDRNAIQRATVARVFDLLLA